MAVRKQKKVTNSERTNEYSGSPPHLFPTRIGVVDEMLSGAVGTEEGRVVNGIQVS